MAERTRKARRAEGPTQAPPAEKQAAGRQARLAEIDGILDEIDEVLDETLEGGTAEEFVESFRQRGGE